MDDGSSFGWMREECFDSQGVEWGIPHLFNPHQLDNLELPW